MKALIIEAAGFVGAILWTICGKTADSPFVQQSYPMKKSIGKELTLSI